MKTIKQVTIIAGIAALGWGAYVAGDRLIGSGANGKVDTGKSASPRLKLVDVAAPKLRVMDRSVEAVGTSRAHQSIEVVSLAAGRVVAIEFQAGQQVKKGDILVRLDSDIERADVEQAEAVLKEAELAMERAKTLQARNVGKRSTVEEMVVKLATARATLNRAHRRLADRTVRASFDGIVGIRRIDIGARVDNNTVLTTLDDLGSIDIDFLVPEDHFGQIARGQKIIATTAAFPGRSFEGVVTAIDSRIDQVGRAFRVRATVPNPDGTLAAGLFMLVNIVLNVSERLTVPEEAVVPEAGRTLVFVVRDGKAFERQVAVGKRERGFVEIRSGLAAGEPVVIKGFAALRDGMSVRVAGSPGSIAKGGKPLRAAGSPGESRPTAIDAEQLKSGHGNGSGESDEGPPGNSRAGGSGVQ
ncbi:MAG: efflux RND transporter periplasmic adaptor subunit [Hyphomicrobiaceae bacterium]